MGRDRPFREQERDSGPPAGFLAGERKWAECTGFDLSA